VCVCVCVCVCSEYCFFIYFASQVSSVPVQMLNRPPLSSNLNHYWVNIFAVLSTNTGYQSTDICFHSCMWSDLLFNTALLIVICFHLASWSLWCWQMEGISFFLVISMQDVVLNLWTASCAQKYGSWVRMPLPRNPNGTASNMMVMVSTSQQLVSI